MSFAFVEPPQWPSFFFMSPQWPSFALVSVLFMVSAGLVSAGLVSGFFAWATKYPCGSDCIWKGLDDAEKAGEAAKVRAAAAPKATVRFFLLLPMGIFLLLKVRMDTNFLKIVVFPADPTAQRWPSRPHVH